jgi:ribosomal protein S18 acetylase RimI-like enzyme
VKQLAIRALGRADAAIFRSLRLYTLQESPAAFASSYEEECERSLDTFAQRVTPNELGCVFGAFAGDELIGMLGVRREEGRKLAHKAFVWGVFVKPEFRQQGAGAQLVEAALAFARAALEVRQVTLGVNATNSPAIALYERVGFVRYGHELAAIQVNGVLHDQLLMVKVFEQ